MQIQPWNDQSRPRGFLQLPPSPWVDQLSDLLSVDQFLQTFQITSLPLGRGLWPFWKKQWKSLIPVPVTLIQRYSEIFFAKQVVKLSTLTNPWQILGEPGTAGASGKATRMAVISVLWRRFKRQFLQFLDWWRDVQLDIFFFSISVWRRFVKSPVFQNQSESSEATGSPFFSCRSGFHVFHVLWWQWIDSNSFKIQIFAPRIAGSLQAQSNEVPGFVDVWDIFSHFGYKNLHLLPGKGGIFVPGIPPIPSRLQRFMVFFPIMFRISMSCVFDKRSIWEDGLGL